MDPIRQIRLLIAPFFFFASLITAGLLSSNIAKLWPGEIDPGLGQIAGLAGIVGISVLPFGFLISTISMLMLRLFFIKSDGFYQSRLSEEELDLIWPKLKTTLKRKIYSKFNGKREKTPGSTKLKALVTFDHGIIYKESPGVFEWLTRTYTAFVVSVNSAIALALSFVVIIIINLCPPWPWWVISIVIFLTMVIGALSARRDNINVFKFQLYRH